MNAISIDTLKLRIPPIEYKSPPVCEVTLSGSGFPSIDLEAFGDLLKPGPIQPPDFPNDPFFEFPPTDPQPLCVTIAMQQENGQFIVVDECVPVTHCADDPKKICWPPPQPGCFKVQVITEQGASPFSDPICIIAPDVTTLAATGVT